MFGKVLLGGVKIPSQYRKGLSNDFENDRQLLPNGQLLSLSIQK